MSVQQQLLSNAKQVIIKIHDLFDFSLHQKFRDAYINCNELGLTYVVDLSEARYMDSSALGMILLLKDHAEKNSGSVVIKHPNEAISKVLEIAQFHRLFLIER